MNRWGAILSIIVTLGYLPLGAEEVMSEAAPVAASKSSLTAELKIGTDLENRDIAGAADSFAAETTQLVGWTRITGATEPTKITHIWKWNGKEVGSVSLGVTSSPYRTYSRKTVMGSGSYLLEVYDAEKQLIGSKEVQVEAPIK